MEGHTRIAATKVASVACLVHEGTPWPIMVLSSDQRTAQSPIG